MHEPTDRGEDAAPVKKRSLSAWVLMVACIATMLAISACYGFYDLFSTFMPYDDEGFWLISTKLFLEGHVLYDQIFIPYGPVSIAVKEALHGVLSIPLTNSAVRFVTLTYWMLLSATCGLTVYRITESPWWAAVTYGVVFAAMRAFTNEPGHPQELIACLGALIPFVLWSKRPRGLWIGWFLAGALVALIFATKINIGVYCLAAVLVVMASELARSNWRNALQFTAIVASVIFPFVLMLPHMDKDNCLPYAIVSAAVLSASAISLLSWRGVSVLSLRMCIVFVTGMVTAILLTLAFMWANGSTLTALVESILYFANGLQHAYFFRHYSLVQVGLALVAPIFAAFLVWAHDGPGRQYSIAGAKALLVGLTVFAIVTNDQANAHYMLGWAGPWCWLCAIQTGHGQVSIARKTLALLAAWHVLLAYPIPGSQLYFGTYLVIVSAVVCLSDITSWLVISTQRYSVERQHRLSTLTAAMAAFFVLVFLTGKTLSLKQDYAALEPLNIQGTRFLRLEPERVKFYRYVVDEMGKADVGFTSSGFNSLYFWSGVQMPAPVVVQHNLRLSSEKDRRAVIRGLAAAKNPLVLMRQPAYGIKPPKIDLTDWIKSEFDVYRRYNGYLLMRRKSK
ncbi:MAG: hypothetical protein ACR2P1_09015 [Pseudomonadales bacterium]